MKKSHILIFAVFLVAGCVGTQPTSVDVNRGISIVEFSLSPSNPIDGEPVIFDVEIENVGGTTARNVQVDFFGVEEQWRDDTGDLIDSTLTQSFGRLQPPVPDRGIPGDNRIASVIATPPDIPQGVTTTKVVEARVSYDYNTSGYIDIPAVSEDEYRVRQAKGTSVPFPITVVNSAGPIHMSLDQRSAPIRVDTISEEDFQIWPIRIQLTDVGDGDIITPEDDVRIRGAGGQLLGTIEIFGPGAEFEDCLGETGGTFIDLNSADIPLHIRDTGTASISCTIKIDKDVWNDRPEDTIQLVFNMFYRYYVSQTASVTISGR